MSRKCATAKTGKSGAECFIKPLAPRTLRRFLRLFGTLARLMLFGLLTGANLRIGVTIWNGRVSPVFDVSHHLTIYETSNGAIVKQEELSLPEDPIAKVSSLTGRTLDVIICGAVSGWVGETIESSGIKLFPFVAGEAGPVLQAFLRGEVKDPSWSMPGCCRSNHRPGRRRCRGAQGRQEEK